MPPHVEFLSDGPLAAGLTMGASAATVLGAAWAIFGGFRKFWKDNSGRRRAQANILDRLTCGSPIKYVDSLLGIPQFTSRVNGRRQNIYALSGAWVLVEYESKEVVAFTITIRDKKMWYRTRRLTASQVDIRLGRHAFDKVVGEEVTVVPPGADTSLSKEVEEIVGPLRRHGTSHVTMPPLGTRIWWGLRRHAAQSYFYFGNPGNYQHYWLSYSQAGAGCMSAEIPLAGTFVRGEYDDLDRRANDRMPDIGNITINTLTVLDGKHSCLKSEFMAREELGPDPDTLRLAGYWVPTRLGSMRRRVNGLWQRLTGYSG